MTWTVACFCGNVYTAPPDRCEVCGGTVERGASKDAASHRTQNGTAVHSLADRYVPCRCRARDARRMEDPTGRPGR